MSKQPSKKKAGKAEPQRQMVMWMARSKTTGLFTPYRFGPDKKAVIAMIADRTGLRPREVAEFVEVVRVRITELRTPKKGKK